MPAFYNQATLTYGDRVVNSNTVQGELSAALRLEKTALQERYRPGDMISYAISVINSGATDAEDLQLTDDLGAYDFGSGTLVPMEFVRGSAKYYVNGELQDGPDMSAEVPLTIRGVSIPAGGNAIVLFTARVNEFAPLGSCATLTSTARLDRGASAGLARAAAMPAAESGVTLPLSASSDIHPETEALLTIHKSLTPTTVSVGEPLTYTLRIENSGATPVQAGDGAMVTDRFDPLLDISSVRYNGEEWTSPANYSYDRSSGLFSSAAGQLIVPAATFTQSVHTGRWQIEPGVSTIEITGTLR